LDFANFYRIFIKDYSKISTLLTCFIEKDKFVWNEKAEEAFEALKKAFTSILILLHTDFSKLFFLKEDALDFALGQYGQDERLHRLLLLQVLFYRNQL
jgi:hypothetical protein